MKLDYVLYLVLAIAAAVIYLKFDADRENERHQVESAAYLKASAEAAQEARITKAAQEMARQPIVLNLGE